MRLGFLTGALAAGMAGAALAGLVTWAVSMVAGGAVAIAGLLAVAVIAGVVVGAATFLAEELALRRTYARMRATGEPWAYRER